ncbi:hypothetical protein ABT337_01220 [Saccharopolyspora hirsuta]|uniref:Uncharacterized protein n=1 Tax=Saccharopolyspora hirsuta TaxID=1837 RepID=A0A5M7BUB4_SACHI|nr:hypothetical protein [Saccharopolyspora hirsuta]KAA5831777.1 hypothetical protein F1721_18210 [Saccharopolyspora hirsuta]
MAYDLRYLANDRPVSPFEAVPNYKEDLSGPAQPPNTGVPMTRHHIVPYVVLKNYWNMLLDQRRFGDLRLVLREMARMLFRYRLTFDAAERRGVAALAEGITAETHDPDAQGTPQFYDGLMQVYFWLPGNLFIGPRSRSDDPGPGFDAAARGLGLPFYGELLRVYENMASYTANPSSGNRVNSALCRVVKRQNFAPVDSKRWTVSNGKYRITG